MTLHDVLVSMTGKDHEMQLLLSILICLRNITPGFSRDSVYLLPLFWVSLALTQVDNSSVVSLALELLLAVLQLLDDQGICADADERADLTHSLFRARIPTATGYGTRLDKLCGVNFEHHFAFSIATMLIKGINYYGETRMLVGDVLAEFLFIEKSTKSIRTVDNKIRSDMLGYVAGMLPFISDSTTNRGQKRLFEKADIADIYDDYLSILMDNSTEAAEAAALLSKLDIADKPTALLFLSMLACQLESASTTAEQLVLYTLLAEAATVMPEDFAIV